MATFGELLEIGQFTSGSACVDCLFMHAGDGGENTDPTWSLDNFLKAIEVYDLSLGHLHDGEFKDQNCFHAGEPCEDDCDCTQTTFSNASCVVCGTQTAGSRDDMILIKRELLDSKATGKQIHKLQELCLKYDVPFSISDYFIYDKEASMMAGWAEGWVGGSKYSTRNPKSTIYIGVSPEGDSHS